MYYVSTHTVDHENVVTSRHKNIFVENSDFNESLSAFRPCGANFFVDVQKSLLKRNWNRPSKFYLIIFFTTEWRRIIHFFFFLWSFARTRIIRTCNDFFLSEYFTLKIPMLFSYFFDITLYTKDKGKRSDYLLLISNSPDWFHLLSSKRNILSHVICNQTHVNFQARRISL